MHYKSHMDWPGQFHKSGQYPEAHSDNGFKQNLSSENIDS